MAVKGLIQNRTVGQYECKNCLRQYSPVTIMEYVHIKTNGDKNIKL